jgi:hypothetical protein
MGMRTEFNKGFLLLTATRVLSAITIVFAVLSITNLESYPLRIVTQASLCLLMVFNGINIFAKKKQKQLGYLFFGVAVFLLFVMAFTVFVGFEIGRL